MKSNRNRFKIVYVLQQISLAINILQIQSIIFIEHIKTIIEHKRCLQKHAQSLDSRIDCDGD